MPDDLYKLVESTYDQAILRAIEIIEEEMTKTSPDSGHGKAQRAFGRKLLDRLAQE